MDQRQLDNAFESAGFKRTTTGGNVGARVFTRPNGDEVFVADFAGEGHPIAGQPVEVWATQSDRPEPYFQNVIEPVTPEAFLLDWNGEGTAKEADRQDYTDSNGELFHIENYGYGSWLYCSDVYDGPESDAAHGDCKSAAACREEIESGAEDRALCDIGAHIEGEQCPGCGPENNERSPRE